MEQWDKTDETLHDTEGCEDEWHHYKAAKASLSNFFICYKPEMQKWMNVSKLNKVELNILGSYHLQRNKDSNELSDSQLLFCFTNCPNLSGIVIRYAEFNRLLIRRRPTCKNVKKRMRAEDKALRSGQKDRSKEGKSFPTCVVSAEEDSLGQPAHWFPLKSILHKKRSRIKIYGRFQRELHHQLIMRIELKPRKQTNSASKS